MTHRMKAHIRLGIRSVSPSDQSPRRLISALTVRMKVLTYPSRIFAEFLRKMSLSFSKNFCGFSPQNLAEKTLSKISHFYFSPRNKKIHARGVSQRNTKKELFSWADLYIQHTYRQQRPTYTISSPMSLTVQVS